VCLFMGQKLTSIVEGSMSAYSKRTSNRSHLTSAVDPRRTLAACRETPQTIKKTRLRGRRAYSDNNELFFQRSMPTVMLRPDNSAMLAVFDINFA
jgi:hypothetical protein